MKKIKCLCIAVSVFVLFSAFPFAVFADGESPSGSEPALIWDFYYESEFDKIGFSNFVDCSVDWHDNMLRVISDYDIMDEEDAIGDPYFSIDAAARCGLDCDGNQWLAIKLCNRGEATQYEGHFGTTLHSMDGAGVFHMDIDANMTEAKVFVCHIPTQNEYWTNVLNAPGGLRDVELSDPTADYMEEGDSHWEGKLTAFRVDGPYYGGVSGLCPGDVEMDIAWIAFFGSEEAARSYEGPDHSQPTPEPVVTPAPEIGEIIPCGTVIFHDDSFDDFWSNANNIEDYYYNSEENCYELEVAAGGDPFIAMRFDEYILYGFLDDIDLDEYKVMQMKVKINPSVGKTGNIYFTTDAAPGAYAEAQNVRYNYASTDEWQIVNVDFSGNALWTGYLSATRLDPWPEVKRDSASFKIEYISFFKNVAEAEAFAASGSEFPVTPTPAPTATPTPRPAATPTPEPAATPEAATPGNEPTKAPEKTSAPSSGKTGCGGVIGGGLTAVIAVAAFAAIRKKH